MVALLVVGIIILFLVSDLIVQLVRKHRKVEPASTVGDQTENLVPLESITLPSHFYHSQNHLWFRLLPTGEFMVGMDAFMQTVLGELQAVLMPETGKTLNKGDRCCTIMYQGRSIHFMFPIAGTITFVNPKASEPKSIVPSDPYRRWFYLVKPQNMSENIMDIQKLKIGEAITPWIQEEFKKINVFIDQHRASLNGMVPKKSGNLLVPGVLKDATHDVLKAFENEFLSQA
jgi:glycine cleavage system H lipoate-binding protein